MKRKLVATALVFAMAASLLAGCGGSSGSGGSTQSGSSTSSNKKNNSSSGSGSEATSVSNEYEEVTVDDSDIVYHKATDMTTDEITLTYFHFDSEDTVNYLAQRFMEIYPNITVVATYEDAGTYDDTLLTLVSNGETPDCIMYTDADFVLSNSLVMDISDYWDTDEETAELASTIAEAGFGKFQTTDCQFAVPVKFFPGIMYVDLSVCETLNLDVPSRNWTWDEMIQLIKDATVTDSPDGMAYYGLGYYNRLDSLYGIASSQDIIGEFGFDGTYFDLSAWAVGEQQFADLSTGGYRAPSTSSQEMEDWAGDWDAWFGSTGHVAVASEAYWTFQDIWNTDAYKEGYSFDWVPYVIPAVSEDDASSDHHTIATIDCGGITTSCQYPREAYELLKFMSYGVDGWKTRIEAYNDPSVTTSSGDPLKVDLMPAPITTNEEVWDEYIDMYCDGMDDEHRGYWEEYFASCMQPISYGWESIAGYWNYCDQYFNNIGIHDLVDSGTAKAADYVDEGTRKANYYHAQAMIDYFGPGTYYDCLSDEEVELYNQIIADNS